MTDPSDSPAPPGPQAPPAGSGSAGWRANARFAADIVNTLAVPLLTIAATVVGLYATNSLKQREIAIATESNRQALRNQRVELEDAIADLERTVVVVDGMLKEREAAAPKAATAN